MIAVFSGTGNSMYVARKLAALLRERIFVINSKNALPEGDGARLIWVFPVYSWGVPPVVRQFISRSDLLATYGENFAVMTCGDDAGLADSILGRDLRRHGAELKAAFTVQMPNTYVCMSGFDVDDISLAEAKIRRSAADVPRIAEAIREHSTKSEVVRGRFAWIKTRVIYPWFCRFDMSPKPFHAEDTCVGCGLCAANCPLANIVMDGGRPHWGADCALCLRCYHICPHHAAAYGRSTRNKGRYTLLMKEVLRKF